MADTSRRLIWLFEFLRLSRPLFLAGGFLLHALGVTIALYQGAALNWVAYLWGQMAVTATQLMTHYTNEYFDYAADVANQTPTPWSGGSRVLPEGNLSPRVARNAAIISGLVAGVAVMVLVLVIRPGPLTLPLFGLSIFLAWGYSAPPFQLHSRGVGEFVVAVLVPGLTILVGYYLQAGRVAALPLLAALPLCGFQFSMILGVQYPDVEGDRIVEKLNLTARYGRAWAAKLQAAIIVGVLGSLPLLVWSGLPSRVAGLLLAVAIPISLWLLWQLWQKQYAEPGWWSWIAFYGIALVMVSALAEWIAFLSLF